MRILIIAAVLVAMPAMAAFADSPPPPEGAKPLSQILQGVENSPNFRYFDEIEWEHGSYEIKFYTKDGTRKKIYIDPVTGKQL